LLNHEEILATFSTTSVVSVPGSHSQVIEMERLVAEHRTCSAPAVAVHGTLPFRTQPL